MGLSALAQVLYPQRDCQKSLQIYLTLVEIKTYSKHKEQGNDQSTENHQKESRNS
jgi:hypothetical protein